MNRFENMSNFVKIVEAGTISAAANRLNTAKSVVSRRLKELEEHLGVELFHRTTRRMKLTETGLKFYQQCIRILADIVEAELATSQAHGTLKGSLKVAIPSSFGIMHMGKVINDFLKIHPHIKFDLDFNDREVDLMQEGFDLAIRIASLPDSSLIARPISLIKGVICASPLYLEKMGIPKSLDELIDHQCLAYNLVTDIGYWHLADRKGKLTKVKIQPYLKASTGEFLRDMAVQGKGIILLPSFICYKEIETGALITILKNFQLPQLNAYAIYPQTRYLSRRVRVFIDFLVNRFQGIPYWDKCINN